MTANGHWLYYVQLNKRLTARQSQCILKFTDNECKHRLQQEVGARPGCRCNTWPSCTYAIPHYVYIYVVFLQQVLSKFAPDIHSLIKPVRVPLCLALSVQ